MNGQLIGQEKQMIKFYKNKNGQVMYRNDTYLETDKLVIERPATDDDASAQPDEYQAFVATTAPAARPKRRTTVRPDGAA